MSRVSVSQGFFILSRSNLITKLISIIYVPLLLALLGPAGHGDYALAYVYYGSLVTLLSDAITKTMIRRVSAMEVRGETDQAILFTRSARQLSLALSLIVALIVALASRGLAGLLHAPDLWLSLIVLAISLVFVSLAAVYRAYFQATRRMSIAGNALVIEQLINGCLTIGLSWAFLSSGVIYALAGAAGGTLIGGLAAALYLHYHFNRLSREVVGRVAWEPVFQLIKPLLGLSFMLQLCLMLEALIVKRRLAGLGLSEALASMTYSDITSYKMAQSIPMILLSALASALYPAITESITQGDIKRFYRRIDQALRHSYLITLPASAGIALVAKELTAFAFDGRLQREQLIIAGAFMVIPMSLAMIQQAILQSDGRLVVSQLPLIVSAFVQVLMNLALIREPFGIMGAPLAGYLGLISLVLTNHLLLKHRQVELSYIRDLGRPLLASGLMSLGLLGLKYWLPPVSGRLNHLGQMLFLVGVGGLIYGVSLLLLGGIRQSDIRTLPPGLLNKLPRSISRHIKE